MCEYKSFQPSSPSDFSHSSSSIFHHLCFWCLIHVSSTSRNIGKSPGLSYSGIFADTFSSFLSSQLQSPTMVRFSKAVKHEESKKSGNNRPPLPPDLLKQNTSQPFCQDDENQTGLAQFDVFCWSQETGRFLGDMIVRPRQS